MDNMHEGLADTLNELVRINYDRIFGYERAIEELNNSDMDLRAIFSTSADTSREFIAYWQNAVRMLGGTPATDSTVRGKLFRVWMDFKATLTGSDREAILKSCIFGEEAAIRAYEEALGTSAHLPDNHRQEITRQKAKIQDAHRNLELYAKAHDVVT